MSVKFEDRPVRAVIFDLDDCLVETMEVVVEAFREATRVVADIEISKEWMFRHGILSTQDLVEKLCEIYGDDFPFSEILEHKKNLTQSSYSKSVPVMPGVHQTLDELDALKVPSIIATGSSDSSADLKLKMSGLVDRFDSRVTGDMVKKGKPEPVMLYMARQVLIDSGGIAASVPIEHYLMVGDHHYDMFAARRAGMQALYIPTASSFDAVDGLISCDMALGSMELAPAVLRRKIRLIA